MLNYFIPSGEKSIDELRKARLLIRYLLLLAAFSSLYLVVCYITDIIIGVYTNLIMLPLVVAGLFTFKLTGKHIRSSNLMISGLVLGISEGVLFSGSIQSPAILWLITAPSAGFLLGNKKLGDYWTVIVICTLLCFGTISMLNINVPYLFPSGLDNPMMTFTLIAVTVFFSIIIHIYETTRSEANNALHIEKKKSDDLLHNILPEEVAAELKLTGNINARLYNNVTVLFTDFVGFTKIASTLSPKDLVEEIHKNFMAYDHIIEKHGLEKIKTIGDSYMAVAGLPFETNDHAQRAIQAATEISNYNKTSNSRFQVRIGLHSGPVVAGIVGVKKYAYDIWGNTLNTAARMEQHSEPSKINISQSTYDLVKDQFSFVSRGKITAKNIGEMEMYFLEV